MDPAALTFEAEGAAGQSVKVTASGEGITWSAAIDEAAKEWITLSTTEGAEGETTLTVTVQDNPDTAERSANVTLTPSAESAGPKAIRVTQEAKVLPPSLTMTYNDGDVPEEGFVIDYLGRKRYTINVVPVNLDWNVRVSYDNEKDWLTVNPFKDEDSGIHNISINANDKKNENSAPRTARVIVTTDVEGIGPFEIPVTQESKPEFLSTLEEDVDFGVLTQSRIAVYPNDELRHQPYTLWELKLWDEGITLTSSQMFIGTGNRLHMKLYTDPIEKMTTTFTSFRGYLYSHYGRHRRYCIPIRFTRYHVRPCRILPPEVSERHLVHPHGKRYRDGRCLHHRWYNNRDPERRRV